MPRGLRWLLALAALALAGADRPTPVDPSPCRHVTFEGDGFVVCRYTPGGMRLQLASRGAQGALSDWAGVKAWLGPGVSRVAFAMNAGMYDPAQRPLGLFIENGRRLRPLNTSDGSGNFFLKPNGVFWIDRRGDAHISETGDFAGGAFRAKWATQSGPLLLHAGTMHPAIAANGTSLTVRNGVAVKGGDAFFAISDGPVSFGRFVRLFRDELGCGDALYLDGTISSLWAPALGRQDEARGLGTFVIVSLAGGKRP